MARVEGFEPNPSGQQPVDGNGDPAPVGVWGDTDSDSGSGVFGSAGVIPPTALNIPLNTAGVEGHGFGTSGIAGESDVSVGVLGRSGAGSGMLGVTFNQTPGEASGVFGSSVANGNGVTGFVGSQTGVVGSSVRGTGVRGTSTGIGVFGENVRGRRGGAPGVSGRSGEAPGVLGGSDNGPGVRGSSSSNHGTIGVTTGPASGAHGLHFSTQAGSGCSGVSVLGEGVDGFSFTGTGVRGESTSGLAGDFVGNVRVTGTVMKGGGGFEIDHPLDPENMYLAHSFVESPDMLNVYSGTVITGEDGTVEVLLPRYFDALNGDARYQLTVIGEFAQAIVSREARDNRFEIRTDRPRTTVCWQVTGVRKDRWADANRIAVETKKDEQDRGHYLHPEVTDKRGDGIRGRADDARRRVVGSLPEDLRAHVEHLLSGSIDRDDLARLARELADIADGPEYTSPDELETQWRRVQQMVGRSDDAGTGAENR